MNARRLGAAVAVLALSTMTVVSFQAPASAQTAPGPGCPNPGGQYPPGQDCPPGAFPGQGQGVSDDDPTPGQPVQASSGRGSFDPGSRAEYGVESTYIKLGETTVNADGAAEATMTLPDSLSTGQHHIVFKGIKDGAPATVRLPIAVVAAGAGAGSGAGGQTDGRGGVLGALPRTGSQELVPVAASGVALVVLGAATIVVARRRRHELDTISAA